MRSFPFLRNSLVFILFGKPLFHCLLVLQHSFSPPELTAFGDVTELRYLEQCRENLRTLQLCTDDLRFLEQCPEDLKFLLAVS
jgi:hypothetical protein